jgi:Carbohydrate-selective porin, OprB family
VPGRRKGNHGLYGVIKQQIHRPAGGNATSGISMFSRISVSPSDRNPINFFVDGGIVFAGLRYAHGTQPNGYNITAMAYDASWNSTDQIPRRAVDSGLIGRFGAVDPTDGGTSSRYSVSGEWRQTEGSVSRAANF